MAYGFCGSLEAWREKRLKQMNVGGRIRTTCGADWRSGDGPLHHLLRKRV